MGVGVMVAFCVRIASWLLDLAASWANVGSDELDGSRQPHRAPQRVTLVTFFAVRGSFAMCNAASPPQRLLPCLPPSPHPAVAAGVRFTFLSCLPQVQEAPKFFVATCTRGNKRDCHVLPSVSRRSAGNAFRAAGCTSCGRGISNRETEASSRRLT
jgi:hypothetical protein